MRSRVWLARAAMWLLALSTLLVALLLMGQCAAICRAGAFTREIARERLAGLRWAGWVWLAVLVLTSVLRARCGDGRTVNDPRRARLYRPGKPMNRKGLAQWIVFAAAVVLLALGVMNGGMRDVMVKAVNICTECIGLG